VTLVVTVQGRESIWMLADRRLSGGRAPKDDARKLMFLETTDGQAILGYAGLGATALGTEPADWMSSVLRGRKLSLEQSLNVLADAVKRQLPRHMVRIPGGGGPSHNVIVPAFVGDDVRLYTIDLAFAPDRRTYRFRYTRHVVGVPTHPTTRPPRLSVGGSGGFYLLRDKRWVRGVLRLINAHDRGRVTPRVVADHLAALNFCVHEGMRDERDESVGPRCIVAWRYRKGGIYEGGGGHQFYTAANRDEDTWSLPTIAVGMDVHAILGVMMPHLTKFFEATNAGEPDPPLFGSHYSADVARLPHTPDERLR
jgi:hypothetical protein